MKDRKYFGTDGIRGRIGVMPITAEFALKLGWAVGQAIGKGNPGIALIGKDTRISGYMLVAALQAGLISAGLDTYLVGPLPTPGVAYLTRSLGARIGVVVSASHNPYFDNGIKFFCGQGKKLPDVLESEIESYLEEPLTTAPQTSLGRAKNVTDGAQQYRDFCKQVLGAHGSLAGLKIVLDCANGATYHIAPKIFAELGATVYPIHDAPNGFNINEQCGSTSPQDLQRTVLAHGADLGIAFDGDGDRVIFVDHTGEIVDGDELLYILACAYQHWGLLSEGVVGTHMSNLGLESALQARGISLVRTKVGDRYVMDALLQRGWCLGGETSGHIICLDKTTTGDGIISALQVLRYMSQTGHSLMALKKGMSKYAQVLLNIPVNNGVAVVQDQRVQRACKQGEKELHNRGRIVLRPSGTEALVRVMVEGEDQHLIHQVAQDLAQIVTDVNKVA